MIYTITCEALTDDERKAVQAALDKDKRVIDWLRFMSHSWAVDADVKGPQDLRAIVHNGVDKKRLLVTQIFPGTYNGWQDQTLWDWINKRTLPAAPQTPKQDKPANEDANLQGLEEVTDARPLDSFTGIDDAAAAIRKIAGGFSFRAAAAKTGLKLEAGFANMLLLGQSGTGKTSTAKAAAVLLKEKMPSASKKKIYLVKASDLIDRHVGKSMDNTRAALEAVGDGILIFDEIDTVMDVSYYGAEVLNTLNTHMGNSPNKPVIIGTLYTKNEQRFRMANTGLSSRFPHAVRMPSYDDALLTKIFETKAEEAGMSVDPAALPAVGQLIGQLRIALNSNFGHAREIDNIFAATLDNIALRFDDMPPESKSALDGKDKAALDELRAIIGRVTLADIPVRDSMGMLVRREAAPAPVNDDTPGGERPVLRLPPRKPAPQP